MTKNKMYNEIKWKNLIKKKICMITVVILEHFFSNPDMPQQNPCTLFLAVSSRISKVSPCRHKDFLKYIARVMNIEMVMPIALYNVPFDFFSISFYDRNFCLYPSHSPFSQYFRILIRLYFTWTEIRTIGHAWFVFFFFNHCFAFCSFFLFHFRSSRKVHNF